MASLYFIKKDPDGPEIELRGSIKVGRLETNDIVLRLAKFASRHHATLTVEGDRLFVEDTGSSNGTFVNGHRIGVRTPLQDQDHVRFDIEEYVVRGPPVASDNQKTMFRGADEAKTVFRPADPPVVPPAPPVVLPPEAVAPPIADSTVKVVAPASSTPPKTPEAPSVSRASAPSKQPTSETPAAPAPTVRVEPSPAPASERTPESKTKLGSPPATPAPAVASTEKAERPSVPAAATPNGGAAAQEGAKKEAPAPPREAREVSSRADSSASGVHRRPGAWIDPQANNDDPSKTKFVDRSKASATVFDPNQQQLPQDVQVPTLMILSGKRAGERIELKPQGNAQEWSVGSDDGLAIMLKDDGVSHTHAAIERNDGLWTVCNKLSANGVFVNGKPTARRVLSSNDRIDFGPVQTRFLLPKSLFGSSGQSNAGRRLGSPQVWLAVGAFLVTICVVILLKVFRG